MIIDMFPSLWVNKRDLDFFAHSLQQSFLHGVKHYEIDRKDITTSDDVRM